MDLAVICA